ncbi:MAG: hypothetical protein SVR04_05315 [Spirochaetota bacterium]|nr:hypothetical protein [Spirochaetota bacterium]
MDTSTGRGTEPARIDMNEYLCLRTLSKTLQEDDLRTLPLGQYYSLLEMNEHFFKNTLQNMQKKNLVAIGFDRRGLIRGICERCRRCVHCRVLRE